MKRVSPRRPVKTLGAFMVLLVLTFAYPFGALADTLNLGASGDSNVRSGTPNANYGTNTIMDLNDTRDGLVRFDLSSIPAGSTITSATLTLVATGVGSITSIKNYGVHRILVDWDENTVTWNTPGSTAGTHFFASPTDTTAVQTTGSYQWDVTTDVTAFVGGTATNYGWRVIWSSNSAGTNRQVDFGTKENGTSSNRPILTVEYTAAGDGGDEGGTGLRQVDVLPSEIEVSILPDRCTTDRRVQLLLHAHDTAFVRISNLPDLSDGEWVPFEPGTDRTQVFDWTLSEEDGEKTVYIVFKGPFFDLLSPIQTVTIKLDQEHVCQSPEEHAHIVDLEGRVTAGETNPECVSDFAHATVEPYIMKWDGLARGWRDIYVKVTSTSPEATTYSFEDGDDFGYDDAVVHVERVGQAVSAHVDSVTGSSISEVRLRVDAADRGSIDEQSLWHAGVDATSTSKTFDLSGYRELCESDLVPHPHPGDLFQSPTSDVYYLGRDDRRHAFPTQDVLKSWSGDQLDVMTVATYQLAQFPLGENVTLRPGSLVQILGEAPVYVVDFGRMLHRILSQTFLALLRTPPLSDLIYILNPSLAENYVFAEPIVDESEPIPPVLDKPIAIDDLWPGPKADDPFTTHSTKVLDGRVVLESGPFRVGENEIRFRILGKDGRAFTADELVITQQKVLHMIVIRDDFTGYQHIHPEEQDGLWSVKARFDKDGRYYMFGDIVPFNEPPVILRMPLLVGEDPQPGKDFPTPNPNLTISDVEGSPFRAELLTRGLTAGQSVPLAFAVTKDGKPFGDIKPWLEEHSHVIILKHDDLNVFVHTHPSDASELAQGKLGFDTRFPYPGRYTLYAQFSLDGAVRDFPITVDVAAP